MVDYHRMICSCGHHVDMHMTVEVGADLYELPCAGCQCEDYDGPLDDD